MKNKNKKLDKVASLAKRRGFIFPGSEIYGGLANSWDFGPLGVELKNNIKKLWWKMFVQEKSDMTGIDSSIIYNTKVWEASGHLKGFSDSLVECKVCHERLRANKKDEISEHEKTHKERAGWTDPKQFNLMFKTNFGPSGDSASAVYLRPETAQGIFINFKNTLDSSRVKIPFGIAQVGKAFRNEITPGNFIFRTREFEQMEIEYFVKESDWEKYFDYWLKEVKHWVKTIGLDESAVRYKDIPKNELAHYSRKTIDVEFEFPFGWGELYGLAYRTDFDLKSHQEKSGEDLTYRDPETGEKFIPHVIEPSFGVERTLLAVLLSSYAEVKPRSGDGESKHENEVVLRLPKALAPYAVAVLPLSRKEPLVKMAKDIAVDLRKDLTVDYDETQSIGKRYRRQDEIGTPYAVTVDFESLEDGRVTVRDRDTMKQERISAEDLRNYLKKEL